MSITKRNRLLTTWILTAFLLMAVAAQKSAASGEPDTGQTPGPSAQQTGAMLPLAMRIQAVLQGLLGNLAQILP
jgi:hypothetical protein